MGKVQKSEAGPVGPATPVRQLMTRAVAKISPEARLDELARKLAAVEAGALGVGRSDDLVGIVSERDLTRAHGRSDDPSALRVRDIASTDLIWCAPGTSATDAARLMADRGVRHLVVGSEDRGDFEGVVSARDLIRALVAT